MPEPLKLTGHKFGQLTVLKTSGVQTYGGRNMRYWWCLCECGREENILQSALTQKNRAACTVCTRGPCANCGTEIRRETKKNTCSDQCELEKRHAIDLRVYAKKMMKNPDLNKNQWRKKKQRMLTEGTYDQHLARERERPRTSTEKDNAATKKRYDENREDILARRKQRWAALTEEEKTSKRQQRQKANTEWARNNLKDMKENDPEKYKEHLNYQRQKGRESYGRKALNELLQTSQKLGELKDEH